MSATYGPAPIDLLADSEAVRNFKAGNGWLWYALRNAGVPDEVIHNSLATYVDSVNAVSAERILTEAAEWDGWPDKQHVMREAAQIISPVKP